MSTSITEAERRALKRLAHPLEVIVRTGNAGLTDAVIAETDKALHHHELMKVRVLAGDRDARDAMIAQLCQSLGAVLVQRVGHVATIYRPRPKDSKIKALLKTG
jgi:RNA-binding protein